MQLEDLNFADDLTHIWLNHKQIKDKATRHATSAATVLMINFKKTELMINTTVKTPVTIVGEPIKRECCGQTQWYRP
jgi:hypothetical protein